MVKPLEEYDSDEPLIRYETVSDDDEGVVVKRKRKRLRKRIQSDSDDDELVL